jgi:hypothetical protein
MIDVKFVPLTPAPRKPMPVRVIFMQKVSITLKKIPVVSMFIE